MHSVFLPSRAGQKVRGLTSITQSKPRIEPMARERWPLFIRAIAKLKQTGDLGLGDTVTHLIGDTRSERFKKWFHRKFGKSCGCSDRRRWLNARFPYPLQPAADTAAA